MMANKTFVPSPQLNSDPNQEETPGACDNVHFGSDLRINDQEGSICDESYEPTKTTTRSLLASESSTTELQHAVTPRTTFAVKSRDLIASNGADRREKTADGRPLQRLPSPRVGVAPADENEAWTPRSPSPSQFILRPVMPGYRMTADPGYSTSSAVHRYGVEVGGGSEPPDLGLKQAIPAMPLTLAILCCIFNIVCPGLGKSHAIYVCPIAVCQGNLIFSALPGFNSDWI